MQHAIFLLLLSFTLIFVLLLSVLSVSSLDLSLAQARGVAREQARGASKSLY